MANGATIAFPFATLENEDFVNLNVKEKIKVNIEYDKLPELILYHYQI